MATKSPVANVRLREAIGVDQFTQRREVFDQHDTVFLPLPPSPNGLMPEYRDVERIITSNHGKTTSNFKRNAPCYSSMRESGNEDRIMEFRTRKYSDNFTSDLNQSDDVEYRSSMTERTRRLSKMRRDFLNSNLHEPSIDSSFTRTGMRASLPAKSVLHYRIESPNLYKFPFAEPYSTQPQKLSVDLGSAELKGEKENQDPVAKPRHTSLPHNNKELKKIEHQKLFEELLKRYAPQHKKTDWNLPPTRPRVVGSVPKSISDATETVNRNGYGDDNKGIDDDVFSSKETSPRATKQQPLKKLVDVVDALKDLETKEKPISNAKTVEHDIDVVNEQFSKLNSLDDSKDLKELEEKDDEVPELKTPPRKESSNKSPSDKYTDLTIPMLVQQMTEEGEVLEKHTKETKKVKRKRSFLDKLLGRKKEK